MPTLKIDVHMHSAEDPFDSIPYNALELIDRAHELDYQVLSLSLHDTLYYPSYLCDYARERGILLLPGVERNIEGKHVLLLNFQGDPGDLRCFEDLRRVNREQTLIIAAHPFFPSKTCLQQKFFDYSNCFDALEFSHCYTKWVNFNKQAERTAQQYNLPLIGTSDAHSMWQLGKTYSEIEADLEAPAIIDAIRKNNLRIVSQELTPRECLRLLASHLSSCWF